MSEEGEIEIPEEGTEAKSAQQLAELENWVHFSKEINAVYGRSTAMPPVTSEEGEEVPWEGEEIVAPLRALNEDKANSWRIDRVPSTLSAAVGEMVVVRSLVWPGAISLGLGKKFVNLYIGYGTKFSEETHQLQLPHALQKDYGVSTELEQQEDGISRFVFKNLSEQVDVIVDPSPVEEESEM